MRCYNGCPDKQLQAVLDSRKAAEERLKNFDPECRCVFFPSPGYYQVWKNNKPVCGFDNEYSTVETAVSVAIKLMTK